MIKISKESKFSKVNITPNVNYQGFTLIEILVAIAIMSIVFGFIITSAGALQRKSRDQQRTTDLQNIQSALAQFYADQQFYPDSGLNLSSSTQIVSSSPARTYLSTIPKDPTGTSPYCYKPQLKLSESGACDNSVITTSCQYYYLCAQLENGTSFTPNCSTDCSTYNFKITPNSSSQ